jgi:ankyrin repeat protein
MSGDILNLINDNKWEIALKQIKPIFKILQDGRTIFHYACIRGQQKIINALLNLKSIEIFTSDLDGNTGAHLLASSGWDEMLLDILKVEPNFLKIKNNQDQFIFNIVINRPQTLVDIVKIMKDNSMMEYIDYIRRDNKTFLIDLIRAIGKYNNKLHYEVLKEIKNFNVPKSRLPLNYAIEKGYNDVAKFMINNVLVDYNLKDESAFTPLVYSLLYKNLEIAKTLLEKKDININYGCSENRYVPLSLIIKLEIFDLYKDLAKHPNLNYNNGDHMLNIPAYYLIQYLNHKVPAVDDNLEQIYKDILLNSDLNYVNSEGNTCLQLLVKYDLWERFSDVLEKTHIDANVENKYGENLLSYLKGNKLQKFVGIIDTQIKSGINSKIQEKINIILPISTPSYDFGTFNADSIHNITYLMYILHKYKESIIPMQYPNIEKHSWDMYMSSLCFAESKDNDAMFSTIGFYTSSFYAVAPHIIFWRDKYVNYVNPNMIFYLNRAVKSDHRFVIIKLTLSPHITLLHSNILIYDKKRNTMVRFEPYGDWDLADSYHLDKLLLELFESVIDKAHLSTLKFIRPNEYLDKTKFQSISQGDDYNYKNLGDPEGYCLAWSYWFLELKLLNPDVDEKQLAKNAFDLILKTDVNSTNPILQHIRGFAKHLDQEKNKIFESIGVPKQLHYKLRMDKDKMYLLNNYVNQYVINNI